MKRLNSITSNYLVGTWLLVCASAMGVNAQNNTPNVGNDTPPTIQLPVISLRAIDPTAVEGSPPGSGVVWVQREGALNSAVVVRLRYGGTATAGVDYGRLAPWVLMGPNVRRLPVVITPLDDRLDEGEETVEVQLEPDAPEFDFFIGTILQNSNYTIGVPEKAAVTIMDDDEALPGTPPRVTVTAPDAEASEEGPDEGRIRFTRTGGVEADLVVHYAVGGVLPIDPLAGVLPDGTLSLVLPPATNGEDYERLSGMATIPAGARSVDVEIVPIDDGELEGTEVVTIRVLPAAIYNAGDPSAATVRIQDNDREPTVPLPPTLEIVASDAEATEPPVADPNVRIAIDTAQFTIIRHGNPDVELSVELRIAGTARNGLDYELIADVVKMRAGVRELPILITPKTDNAREERETVTLTLIAPICPAIFPPPPWCYDVGERESATVSIKDREGDENRRPEVRITRPESGRVYGLGEPIHIVAEATDPDGYVPRMDFYIDGDLIGTREIAFLVPPQPGETQTFELEWTTAVAGEHHITVRATDDRGGERLSQAVGVVVRGEPPGREATITITSPKNGDVFEPGDEIKVLATAVDPNGYISRVEFFDGDRRVGVSEIVFIQAPPDGSPIHHEFEYTGAAAGGHVLTARGVESNGHSVVSRKVEFRIEEGDGPRLPVVRIEAVQRTAVEGRDAPATLKVTRTGPVTEPLLVNYELSGSAVNGVDYERLGGVLTIPEGRSDALIEIAPFQDSQPDLLETVTVRIKEADCDAKVLTPHCYEVGSPRSATVFILSFFLAPNPGAGGGGGFTVDWLVAALAEVTPGEGAGSVKIKVVGEDGAKAVLEASSDLKAWEIIGEVTVEGGIVELQDRVARPEGRRFYRVRSR